MGSKWPIEENEHGDAYFVIIHEFLIVELLNPLNAVLAGLFLLRLHSVSLGPPGVLWQLD